MKMTAEHFDELKQRLQPAIASFPDTLDAYLKAGMSAKRYRWDVLWHAKQSEFVCNVLYRYLDDDHIDTALRAIFPERPDKFIVGGKDKFATVEEANAHATTIFRRTGNFVSVETL